MTLYAPAFAKVPESWSLDFMKSHPFALVTTVGDDGLPQGTHTPLLLDDTHVAVGGHAVLRGHLAVANSQSQTLEQLSEAQGRATVMFTGAHGFISTSWYNQPDKHAPTWNYEAVHCKCTFQSLDQSSANKKRFLDDLVVRFEGSLAEAAAAVAATSDTSVSSEEAFLTAEGGVGTPVTHDLMDRLLSMIILFELRIDEIAGTNKMGQNKKAADIAGVIAGLNGVGNVALAEAMALCNADKLKESKE